MVQKISTPTKVHYWLGVWKTWYRGKSIHVALEIEEQVLAELNRLFKKFYAEVKDNNMIFWHFLYAHFFMFILLISNHMVFLGRFGINLHL